MVVVFSIRVSMWGTYMIRVALSTQSDGRSDDGLPVAQAGRPPLFDQQFFTGAGKGLAVTLGLCVVVAPWVIFLTLGFFVYIMATAAT